MTITLTRGFTTLVLMVVACTVEAAEWQYSLGLHDMAVPDVSSHTFGIVGHADVSGVTSGGTELFGSFDLFVDHDKDKLDPDHIPIWWHTDLVANRKFWRGSRAMFMGWEVGSYSRMNTVSAIEREIHILPALVGGVDGEAFQASLMGGVGYHFLEFDDDAPRLRGYDRDSLRRTTSAGSLAADTAFRIGEAWEVFAHAEEWWDGTEWIQSRLLAGVHFTADRSSKGHDVTLVAELNSYNLDRFSTPGELPILAWDEDLTIRLNFSFILPRDRNPN